MRSAKDCLTKADSIPKNLCIRFLMFEIINFGIVVLIWLVQMIIYPSMRYWDRESFTRTHPWYTKTITPFIILLMPFQAVLAGIELVSAPSFPLVLQALAIITAWLVTFYISVPLHTKLGSGFDKDLIEKLIQSNWYRTSVWSLVCILDIVKAVL